MQPTTGTENELKQFGRLVRVGLSPTHRKRSDDSGSDHALRDNRKVESGSDFLQQGSHGKNPPHGHAEGHTFCGGAAEGDLGLKLGLPEDGTAKQGENKASAGFD